AWLAGKQSPDGQWQDGHNGAGQNGLCLMSFLASGEDPNFGKYASNIRRAIRAIILSQEPGTGYLPNSMYHHGFAMLALAEAYGTVDEALPWSEGGTVAEEPKSSTTIVGRSRSGANKGGQRTIAQALALAVRCTVTAQKQNRW